MKPMKLFPLAQLRNLDLTDKRKAKEIENDLPATMEKDFTFTQQELIRCTQNPLLVIDVGIPLTRPKLRSMCNRLIRVISSRYGCRFVRGNKPILPTTPEIGCVALCLDNLKIYLCLDMTNMYCKGIFARERFYEAKKSVHIKGMVEGAIPLGRGHQYLDLLGKEKPLLELTAQGMAAGFTEMLKLGTPTSDYGLVLEGIGRFSLTFIEPCRQRCLYYKVLIKTPDPPQSDNGLFYHKLTSNCWLEINSWGSSCNAVLDESIKVLRKTPLEIAKAMDNVLIVNNDFKQYVSSGYRLKVPPRRGI